eukprot:355369-Chlamydomonas_euryale.AAC.1
MGGLLWRVYLHNGRAGRLHRRTHGPQVAVSAAAWCTACAAATCGAAQWLTGTAGVAGGCGAAPLLPTVPSGVGRHE